MRREMAKCVLLWLLLLVSFKHTLGSKSLANSKKLSQRHGFKPTRKIEDEITTKFLPVRGGQTHKVRSITEAYEWYVRQCDDNPLATKSISSGVITALGDFLAQKIEAVKAKENFVLNPSRLSTFFLIGLCFTGPFIHNWYELLWKLGKRMETKYKSSKTTQVLVQLLTDQTIGVALFMPSFFYAFEYIESFVLWRMPSFARANERILNDIKQVFLMQYRVFPLSNLINFSLIPTSLRVLFSNVVALFWNIYLCTVLAKEQ